MLGYHDIGGREIHFVGLSSKADCPGMLTPPAKIGIIKLAFPEVRFDRMNSFFLWYVVAKETNWHTLSSTRVRFTWHEAVYPYLRDNGKVMGYIVGSATFYL